MITNYYLRETAFTTRNEKKHKVTDDCSLMNNKHVDLNTLHDIDLFFSLITRSKIVVGVSLGLIVYG